MRARATSRGVILLLVLALLLTVAALAGCGGDGAATEDSPAAAATAADGRSAEQIVKDSETKMATVNSAAFTADFALKIDGDTSKMTDPTAKALLGQGISLSAEGKSAKEPTAADMTMTLGIAGQNLEFGMKAVGKKAWLEYQGVWYKVDGKNAKALDKQAQSGAAPTEQLKSMGIDPSAWGTEYQLAGTEDLGGVQVYHVKAEADPQKLADSLAKAAEDPSLGEQLGGSGQLGQLGSGLTGDADQAKEIAKTLKSATVEFWIGVDDAYMYKAQLAATMDTSGQKDMQGVSGLSVSGTVAMSDFDQAFDVAAPTGAKPFEEFMNNLFGGMLGGSGSMML
jgi:predicted small lipoprotein YifL